ncbi:protein-tyrosine phosphatase-like protein [Cyathus striatus]|nr:protein-tyrosine phosphatase-like protein [Cyathus striatus]
MDAIRISKSGTTSLGTVHLTAHHLIFNYDEGELNEMWVITRLPQTFQGQTPLTIHTRTFETISLTFEKDNEASDVFDSVKELTVATSVTQLYAFFYTPNPPFPTSDGWSIYSPREEFGRMGVGSRSKAWRFTDINKDYSFCATYPARLVVPTRISDTTLQYASKYRSKCRIPILSTALANFGSITRSSQPMVGITQNRSIQDEKLIEAIFQSHWSPESRASTALVYGATATNLIIDARPTKNAVANTAKGAGTENMDHYKEGKKVYLGIDNIHIMRDSLSKIVEALREADTLLTSINNDLSGQIPKLSVIDRGALRRSGWLRHLSAIMEGTLLITKNVHVNSSHVLIHCSDGWDRTAQLSSLSQLCLDPFYRTIHGFEILIEKDWLSFGHRFLDRCGHLSSEKFFVSSSDNGSGDAAQAFLTSVQNRFVSQHHIKETSPVFHQFLECRFEFNERFLRQMYYHLYSCQFGTFLFNCERERRVGDSGPPPIERTISIWDYFNTPSEAELNKNPLYDPNMGVLMPKPKDIRFWHELYGRTDEEMNGRVVTASMPDIEFIAPIGDAEDDPVLQATESSLLPVSPSRSPVPLPTRLAVSRPATPSRSASPTAGVNAEEPSSLDNFAPFASTSSSFSLRPSSSSPSSSPLQSASPWARTKPPDFSGVKSVWGKLSSNASAAFSVVQDVYSGVAKDLRNTGGNEDETFAKTAELRSRDTLNAWGEERSSPPSQIDRPFSSLTLTNPWAANKSEPQTLESLQENPWGSSTISGDTRTSTVRRDDNELRSPLPLDPTVAIPTPKSSSATNVFSQDRVDRTSKSLPPQEPSPELPSNSDTDPLGVGLL